MCDVFQLLKYFDNFYNFTSHFIKSFAENINFANTISNCLMPEECTLFQTNWKVGFTPLNYGQHDGDIPQTCNNNQNKIIMLPIKYVKMCKIFILIYYSHLQVLG